MSCSLGEVHKVCGYHFSPSNCSLEMLSAAIKSCERVLVRPRMGIWLILEIQECANWHLKTWKCKISRGLTAPLSPPPPPSTSSSWCTTSFPTTAREWSEFFPVQIHHINAVILEPKPKKMLKLHRIRNKSCKEQKWQEIITFVINMPETGQLQLTSQRKISRKNKICSTA